LDRYELHFFINYDEWEGLVYALEIQTANNQYPLRQKKKGLRNSVNLLVKCNVSLCLAICEEDSQYVHADFIYLKH